MSLQCIFCYNFDHFVKFSNRSSSLRYSFHFTYHLNIKYHVCYTTANVLSIPYRQKSSGITTKCVKKTQPKQQANMKMRIDKKNPANVNDKQPQSTYEFRLHQLCILPFNVFAYICIESVCLSEIKTMHSSSIYFAQCSVFRSTCISFTLINKIIILFIVWFGISTLFQLDYTCAITSEHEKEKMLMSEKATKWWTTIQCI